MRVISVAKVTAAILAVSVYVFVPGYRYYVLGSYIGYKILRDKPSKPRLIKKGSKAFNKFMGA